VKLLKALFLALGLWLLWTTVHRIGFGGLGGRLAELGWWILPILTVYPLIYACNTLGWASAFPKPLPASVPWHGLYAVRIIGETLNSVIPWAASLGGEAVKAHLLKRRYDVPVADTLASLLIVHTTLYVSLNAFALGALAVTLPFARVPEPLLHGLLAFLGLLAAGAGVLFGGLRWGLFARFHGWAERFGWAGRIQGDRSRFEDLDTAIRHFYGPGSARFWRSSLFNFLGWWCGVLEVYWASNALGMRVSLAEAWLLEALVQAVRVVTFFIPASVGAQEGGIVMIFTRMGFAPGAALAFAVLRRIREALWIGIGLALYAAPAPKNRPNS